MTYRITLIAKDLTLSPHHFKVIGYPKNSPVWLKQDKAAYIEIEQEPSMDMIKAYRASLAKYEIDIFSTFFNSSTPKRLFLADMDSTIVTSETLDEMAEEAGIKGEIAAITERAMRGELDFHDALRERVSRLKGLSSDVLKRTLDKTELSNGAQNLLKGLKNKDIHNVLVSGGFTYFTQAIADELGFDNNHGNHLIIKDDKLSGDVGEPILDKESKLMYLKKYVQHLSINISDTIAIGDGANDLPMLRAAGLGIGYQPKPLVADTIPNCIVHTDLSSVLYLI